MSYPVYGRYQVAEPPSALACLHIHQGQPLKAVDHEPKVAVIDQSDLLAQGIRCSTFIPGAQDVDALGSCTANATTAGLSNLLPQRQFQNLIGGTYTNTVAAERFAIRFYHECTDQTGDPGQEWPPTDCGSSGPYIVSELKRLKLASGAAIAHGAQNIVSLMQTDGILMGSPWFYAWEQPDAHGFVDGNGSASALQTAIQSGVAGGHETYLCAIEKLAFHPGTSIVDPFNTVLRDRNSWAASWGDHGCCRIHLSTLVMIGGQCDFRQLRK